MADNDELNTSFSELNLEDEATKKAKSKRSLFSEKHDLTPDSKQQGLPQQKVRRTVEESHTLNQSVLDVCIEEEGAVVEQEELIEVLGIGTESKNRLSRALRSVFPKTVKKRVLRDNKQITIYTNIKLKYQLEFEIQMGTVGDNIKKEIQELEETMLTVWGDLHMALEEENKRAESLLLQYRKLNTARENYLTALINIYEKEITKLRQGEDLLSAQQKRALSKEMDIVKGKCNLGYRTDKLKEGEQELPTNVFSNLAMSVTNDCPLLNDIMETLIGSKDKINKMKTYEYKVRCASHALSGLVTLANQKYANDVQLLFGLLCISYGGGKQFINMLNAIGLSLHWDSLMKHLDKRLENFPTIINTKFPPSLPVILLMDNINMYKGNRRHLRIIKKSTPKMWNFTGHVMLWHFANTPISIKA